MKFKLASITLGVIAASIIWNTISVQLHAQESPTASGAATPTTGAKLDDKVQVLKDKIESKVAEISKSNRLVLEGEIASLDDGKIKLKIQDGSTKVVTLDKDFVDIRGGDTAKKLVFKDMARGDYITVYGVLIDTDLSANRIYVQPKLLAYVGQIITVNKDFSLDVVTTDQEQLAIDIEKDTQQQIVDSDFGLKKVGFTKYKEGYKIHLIGELTNEGKRIHAKRILLIPTEVLEK